MAGQYWAATGLKCSDMTSLIGNNVAGMVFDMAKSLDRVTITVYQSAAGSNILSWLSSSVDNLISALGKAIYFPFLAPVVIIGAIWLAWQGLIRKRATRTIEGTIWMVIACAAAIWLIGQPQDFTDVGTTVSNGVTSVLNTAFDNLPAGNNSSCLPIQTNDPQTVSANYAFTTGSGLVDENANELWSVLVCKPWLDGEFGTTQYAQLGTPAAKNNVIDEYGRSLLYAQAFAANEQPTVALTQAKQPIYSGIAANLQTQNPSVYALFQGNQWTTRLEIAFFALFAAVAAGLLVLLIALTLIILKLGFLLLLVAGPFFLIVGVHPGFGRVVAIRWFEMLVGVLLKQVAVALVLSVLLYCYTLIMGTTDQELPWGLKIMMIALVTVAVFIYRKPFQHLFSSVGYGMLGNNERAEVSWRESAFGFRRVSATAAGTVVPGAAASAGAARASRWARRTAADGGGVADGTASGAVDGGGVRATSSEGMSVMPTADSHSAARQWPAAGVGTGRTAPPLPLSTNGAAPSANGGPAGWARNGAGDRSARPGPAAGPPDRADARRAHVSAALAALAAAGAPGRAGAADAARRTPAASADAALDAVLVAVPPPAPVAGPGHGTHARPAAPAVRRRRHRARRPWLLPDRRAEPRNHRGARRHPDAKRDRDRVGHGRSRHQRGGDLHPARDRAGRHAVGRRPTGGANIYQWLPFTQTDLTAAAQDDAGLRRRLRHLELHRVQGGLRRQDGRPGHRAGGRRRSRTTSARPRGPRATRSPPAAARSTRSARSARTRRRSHSQSPSRSRWSRRRERPRARARTPSPWSRPGPAGRSTTSSYPAWVTSEPPRSRADRHRHRACPAALHPGGADAGGRRHRPAVRGRGRIELRLHHRQRGPAERQYRRGQLDSGQLPALVSARRAPVQRPVERCWPASGRWRAMTAGPRCPA